jgi:integrator complex subunit 3
MLLRKPFLKLLSPVRKQVIWLLKELMRLNVAGLEPCCQLLLRNIHGGDLSERNLEVLQWALDAFIESR